MPRRRAVSTPSGRVPAELLDRAHLVWASETLCLRWLEVHGLFVAGPALAWGPLNRHKAAAVAWAIAAGVSVHVPADSPIARPDLKALTGMGVDMSAGSGFVMERLLFAGVKVGA
jgi:hypothetical protein